MATATVDIPIQTECLPQQLANATIHDNPQPNNTMLVRGTIFRKRKYRDNVSLAIRPILENTTDETQPNPPVLVMVSKSDSSMPLEASFVGAVVEIGLTSESNNSSNNSQQHNHQTAKSLTIIRCSPDPNAIQDCLRMVTEGKLALDIFSCQTSNGTILPLLKDIDQAKHILSLNSKDKIRRAMVKRIASGLQGTEPTEDFGVAEEITIRPRKRQTHIKARQRSILEKLEASQNPIPPTVIKTEETDIPVEDTETNDELTYNLPDPNDPTMMSGRHPKTRREYLHDKKWPQIRWLVQRLKSVLETVQTQLPKNQDYIEILDVGGGRGDLAVAVAEAFHNVRVTVVDLNEQSLEGGRAYYQSRKPSTETDDRVLFVCGDFAEYAKVGNNSNNSDEAPKHFDVVTAWHACGDLSDYALEFAVKETEANAKAFVICPCCYTKRYIEAFEPKWIGDYNHQPQQCIPCAPENDVSNNDIRTIQRLAEMNERPEITSRAMGLINTMRLRSLLDLSAQNSQNEEQDSRPTFTITLEEYDLSWSSKNLVLVGIKN